MKRFAILATAVAALAFAAVSLASPKAHAARGTTIQLRKTNLGRILATAGGRTIYVFARDSRNHDRCVSISGCTSTWPLVKSSGRPIAAGGVSGRLLGTIRAGGASQVTYAGWPLYTYTGDSGPGQTGYVGVSQFGGAWYAINAQGKLVK
jgi:predicted lipoprotein with Yx(FWY)xxD motif